MSKSYSTRVNARRALSKICAGCVKHAKEIIEEIDGRFVINEDKVEELMTVAEWQNAYGHRGDGLPDETISPKDEEELANAIDQEEKKFEAVGGEAIQKVADQALQNTPKCPKCGSTELYCGRPKDPTAGFTTIVDEEYITGCHHCDWQEDSRKTNRTSSKSHEAQKTSMKLDRRIAVREGEGETATFYEFKNAHQMWKQNPSWMTSSQQDSLTAKLYAAAKKGEYATVCINGRTFCLVSI